MSNFQRYIHTDMVSQVNSLAFSLRQKLFTLGIKTSLLGPGQYSQDVGSLTEEFKLSPSEVLDLVGFFTGICTMFMENSHKQCVKMINDAGLSPTFLKDTPFQDPGQSDVPEDSSSDSDN